ncbi:MAG: triose-phosphate isomerase family protein [Acidobacteriaceae bacterium]
MKKLIVANWKMNPDSLEHARQIFMSVEHRMHFFQDKTEVAICPPAVYLAPMSHYGHYVKLGAQNIHWEEKGAYTGEISVIQVKQWGVSFAILGHSERRMYFSENDLMVRLKAQLCLENDITPIVCLGGDPKAQKDGMKRIVTKQFKAATKDLDKKLIERMIFVYEPTWAISSNKNAEPATGEHAVEMISHIRNMVAEIVGVARAGIMPMLYGGSVNKDNVHEFAKHPTIDGALVGAASLNGDNFLAVVKEFHRESIHKFESSN